KRYGIAAFVLAACIAFSRMYLFVHFPTDVLGGAVTGVVSAVAAFFLMRWFENRKNENMQA
ncbi:MAG: phosphatase PAP2 family protein, partial [Lachnospiraceae bacterium]|nr:phosphatase PAP2 family protein [Lachnospiraceae bacterium]